MFSPNYGLVFSGIFLFWLERSCFAQELLTSKLAHAHHWVRVIRKRGSPRQRWAKAGGGEGVFTRREKTMWTGSWWVIIYKGFGWDGRRGQDQEGVDRSSEAENTERNGERWRERPGEDHPEKHSEKGTQIF